MVITESKKDALYRDYYGRVFGYVSSHVLNHHDAEDVASLVFLKIFSALGGYDEKRASLSTWIYSITRNTVYDYFRSQKPTEELSEEIEAPENNDGEDMDELLELMSAELKKLPEKQREILILHYYFNLSHKEIAQKVGLSYANTRKQCSLAIAMLKDKLSA